MPFWKKQGEVSYTSSCKSPWMKALWISIWWIFFIFGQRPFAYSSHICYWRNILIKSFYLSIAKYPCELYTTQCFRRFYIWFLNAFAIQCLLSGRKSGYVSSLITTETSTSLSMASHLCGIERASENLIGFASIVTTGIKTFFIAWGEILIRHIMCKRMGTCTKRRRLNRGTVQRCRSSHIIANKITESTWVYWLSDKSSICTYFEHFFILVQTQFYKPISTRTVIH